MISAVPWADPALAPNWAAIDFDVKCSRCGYDVRMLERPRCPECGLEFTWADVLDEARWRSDFLFEHQWRRRPVRSYLVTIWRALRPKRFWSQVSLHMQPQAGTLWFMFISMQIWFCAVLFGVRLASAALAVWASNRWIPGRGWSEFDANLYYACSETAGLLGEWFVWVFFLLPLWAAVIALGGLRQTLARCRVKRIHMLRIVVYSTGPVLAWWIALFLASVAVVHVADITYGDPRLMLTLVACGLCALILGRIIARGTQSYARLPRAGLVGMVTALLSVLVVFTAVMLWTIGY